MINITMFDTVEDLCKLTGLQTEKDLWNNGFNLDDWDVGFVSDVPLTMTVKEKAEDIDRHHYGIYESSYYEYEVPVEGASWLINRMEQYCVGYLHTEYKGKHYYMVYHA